MKLNLLNVFNVLFCLPFILAGSLDKISKLANKNGIIKLTDKNFPNIIGNNEDYHVIALLTTDNMKFGCTTCTKFDPEFDTIFQSWINEHPDFRPIPNGKDKNGKELEDNKPIFFVKATVENPSKIPKLFEQLKVDQIPRLLAFPAGSNNLDNNNDIQGHRFKFVPINIPPIDGDERIQDVINNIKHIFHISKFNVFKPTDWSSLTINVAAVLVILSLTYKHSSSIISFIKSRYIWSISLVTFIVFMCSGYMFTKIRNVPLANNDRDGNIIYFAVNEFQNQYGIETQIVSILYGFLIVLMILLIKIIPNLDDLLKSSNNKNVDKNSNNVSKSGNKNYKVLSQCLAIGCCILLYAIFAAYTNVYALKQNYPFKLMKVTSFLH